MCKHHLNPEPEKGFKYENPCYPCMTLVFVVLSVWLYAVSMIHGLPLF
ncbi:MAG: hypothetical protein ACOYMG_26410 [Candidatus Methylumidiphilus sp.]